MKTKTNFYKFNLQIHGVSRCLIRTLYAVVVIGSGKYSTLTGAGLIILLNSRLRHVIRPLAKLKLQHSDSSCARSVNWDVPTCIAQKTAMPSSSHSFL